MFNFKKQIDFIAIGDIVVDAFIDLKKAEIKKDDKGNHLLCMSFADKIPYDSVEIISAVGNSPNASVSASRLGLKTALITNIGDDQNGKDCLVSLKNNSVITDYITVHPNQKTNYHYVLRFGPDRTILVKHTKFDYKLPKFKAPKWIYLSSMAENSLSYHQQIAEYLKQYPETKLAFQPGTFQMEFGIEKLKDIYTRTEVFFCNKEEAERILNCQPSDIKILAEEIKKIGPKIVVITDGPKGAYAYDGTDLFNIPAYPDSQEPIDRTGAGDSFASTFTVALALGKTMQEALVWGPINSMSVVKYVGAQKGLLTREVLEKFLKEAPENYKVTKL